jgi:type I restriction enzyme, S subunit
MNPTEPFMSLLSNIVDNRGRTCPVAEMGLPLIATNCVKNSTLFPVFEKVRYVERKTYDTWFRGHPLPGDLIFVCKGSPGQVCMTPDPVNFCIAQDMVAVRADPTKVYPPYLFAALRSDEVQNAIMNMHVGTMIPHFKKGDFDKLDIPLPDEATQRFVGDFYLAVTEKIELNRRMNETLEGIAQAIFRDWFVDFGPVRRRQSGETDPRAIMGGLTADPARAAHYAALFPAAFGKDNLPAGWVIGPFSKLVTIIGGGTPKTSVDAYWNGNIPWFSVTDTPAGKDLFVFDTEKSITKEGLERSSARLIPAGTTIITARGTVGNLAITGQEMTFNQSCYALQSADNDRPFFTFLATAHLVEGLKGMAHGSVFSTITRQTFDGLNFADAGGAVMDAFDITVAPLFNRIRASVEENKSLAETRDYLLSRLISGAVRVAPAKRMSEG